MHEATAGGVQFDKTHFQLEMDEKNNSFKIENVDKDLKVSNTSATQFLAIEAVRTLGVHAYPQFELDEQFKLLRKK